MQNLHADVAAAGAVAEQLVEEEEQAAASALAKAAAKKAKKQRQKLKKSPSSPQAHSIDSGRSTGSRQQSPESSALHSMGMLKEDQNGEAVAPGAGPPLPAASKPAVSQTNAAFLLNLFRCPLSKVLTGTSTLKCTC